MQPLASGSSPYLPAPTRGHRPTASESTIVVDDPYQSYTGGDKLIMLSTRDTAKFPPLEAPQPRRPVSIDRRAYIPEPSRGSTPDSMYETPQRGPYASRNAAAMQESTEDVGWDMGGGGSRHQFHYQSTPFSGSSSHLDRGSDLR